MWVLYYVVVVIILIVVFILKWGVVKIRVGGKCQCYNVFCSIEINVGSLQGSGEYIFQYWCIIDLVKGCRLSLISCVFYFNSKDELVQVFVKNN